MKIILEANNLSYVSLGGKMHVKMGAFVRAMCGKKIPTGAVKHESRQLSQEQVCQRCYATLQKPLYRGYTRIEEVAE